jgi:nitroreductase
VKELAAMTVRSNVALSRVGPPALSRSEQNTLLSAAAMAPSVFNTQPWQFTINGPAVEVYADSDRALYWSVDPFGRQAVISCGAAMLNLRVAAAYLGRDVDVVVNPSASDGLLATVTLGPRGRGSSSDAELYTAIRRRHTHRGPFAPRRIPGSVLYELTECVHAEHANIVPVSRVHRRWLFDLVALADVILSEAPGYELDLLKWTAGSTSRPDGIPVGAFGTMSNNDAPPMRDFGAASGVAQRRERFAPDPWIAVLGTDTDDTVAWLHAGQALQRLLLTAQLRGLAASFLNQPLDDPGIRRDMVSAGLGGFPQMILRMGYASGDIATPRRPVNELVRPRRGRR